MDLKLKEKVVIVIGGSQGIGKGIAEALVIDGRALVLTGRRPDDMESTAEENRPHLSLSRAATPEKVALAVVYLASEAASFITGTNLCVAGGSVASI